MIRRVGHWGSSARTAGLRRTAGFRPTSGSLGSVHVPGPDPADVSGAVRELQAAVAQMFSDLFLVTQNKKDI